MTPIVPIGQEARVQEGKVPDKLEAEAPALSLDMLLQMSGNAAIAFMHTDLRGNVFSCNDFFLELVGEVECWSPALWLRCFHPDDHPPVKRNARRAVTGEAGPVIHDMARIRHLDGATYRWVRTCSVLDTDASGQPRSWYNFFIELPDSDVLDRRMRKAVADGETRYRALFDYGSDATMLVHKSTIVDCNDAAAALYGVQRQYLLGREPGSLLAPVQSSGEASASLLLRLRQTIRQDGVMRAVMTAQRMDDGALIETETTTVTIRLGFESFQLVTIRDITAHLAAERELHLSNRALAMQNANLAWLQAASARIYAQPDLETLAEQVVRIVRTHYSAPQVHLALKEPDGYRIVCSSLPPEDSGRDRLLPRNRVIDVALRAPDQLLVIRDHLRDFGTDVPLAHDLVRRGVQSFVIMMMVDEGEELGVLALEYDEAERFRTEDLEGLKVFVRTLTLVVAKLKHLAALEYQARHDTLTGLHNRSVLHSEFERWQAGSNGRATLMLLDLDRFKEINDTLGHHVGDDLLCHIGGRLARVLDSHQALLCRLGGDEFAVLICGQLTEVEQSMAVANQVLLAIRQPFQIDNVQLEISASIGVALYPQQGTDSHALLRFADVAMYEAKRSGAGVMLYDTRLDLNSPQRLRLIADLNNGIRNRELVLHYQPKLDLHSGEILGCEALVRWQHPRLGLLMPDTFVPLAEVGDTIHALTAYVIEAAVEQQRRWLAAGIRLHVAVNLSARNLIDDRIVRQIEQLVRAQRLTPGALELEITETALMHDSARAVILLQQLAALGVRIAIDDFGTGYSSLAYLRRLPIDTLKIDRSFVRDMLGNPQDAVIVQSIIALAHNLDQRVIAEGVEDAAVLESLSGMGCDQMQGYFLSRPLPADEVPDWLAAFAAAGPA